MSFHLKQRLRRRKACVWLSGFFIRFEAKMAIPALPEERYCPNKSFSNLFFDTMRRTLFLCAPFVLGQKMAIRQALRFRPLRGGSACDGTGTAAEKGDAFECVLGASSLFSEICCQRFCGTAHRDALEDFRVMHWRNFKARLVGSGSMAAVRLLPTLQNAKEKVHMRFC